MGSKTHKTEKIRYRKHSPNTTNRKTEQKQIGKNLGLLVKLEAENRKQ